MNRGSVASARLPPNSMSRFNEAPIHESGKSPGSTPLMPMVVASMRPRFMNRGSADAIARPEFDEATASMRPRFMNRGSAPPRPRIQTPEPPLQ